MQTAAAHTLRCSHQGGKHCRWKYRFVGKEKRLALGAYPGVGLTRARQERDAARDLLKAGNDPVQAKKDAKTAQVMRHGTSFEAAAREWFEHWRGPKSPRHAEYMLHRFEADVFPEIGARPIADVTAPVLLAMAKKMESVVPWTLPSGRCSPVARCSGTRWRMASLNATRPPM